MLAVVLACTIAGAFQPATDEDELQPGLVARYQAGAAAATANTPAAIERVDADVQFAWGEGSPDPRLAADRFSAKWTGRVFIRKDGEYRFHVWTQGAVTVRVNGQIVLEGQRDEPGWIDGKPEPLDFGELPLEIRFQKTATAGQIKLFWSSESFPREPVPAQVLFHQPYRDDLAKLERGRELYTAHRCNRCHRRDDEALAPAAPALDAAALINVDWLRAHLSPPVAQEAAGSRLMPAMALNDDERTILVSILAQQAGPALERVSADADSARNGEVIFKAVGCLACHSHGDAGKAPLLGGGDLTKLAKKRSRDWVAHWLQDPKSLNADHRMPIVKLTDAERLDLACFLGGEALPDVPKNANLDAGHALFVSAKCAACHRVSGDKSGETLQLAARSLQASGLNWQLSCTEAPVDLGKKRPSYSLTPEDRAAVRAFVESRQRPLAPESQFDLGARLIHEKQCLSCHDRDGSKGITQVAGKVAQRVPELQGLSEALIPPDLSAVGDKLHDAALAVAIAGEQPTQRLPWLRVRMPRFQHSDSERQALLAYLIGHDRMPETTSKEVAQEVPQAKPKDAAEHKALKQAGEKLLGAKGFSCAACHKIGPLEPRNVALGTRGSDLYRIGERMRYPYFLRWTRSPLRIVPGMEMPSYEKPVAGILKDNLDVQLQTLWNTLNDEKTVPAVDGSSVEQILTMEPGQPARIVRDVFQIGDVNSRFVPRALAVGFHNGQSVLFDLDQMSLVSWWTGDFARQRTQGKSWFWEPGATTLTVPRATSSDIALRSIAPRSTTLIAPHREGDAIGRLLDYEADGLGVRFRYRLEFSTLTPPGTLVVQERFLPGKGARWMRDIQVDGVPSGYAPVLLRTPVQQVLGGMESNGEIAWETATLGKENREVTPIKVADNATSARLQMTFGTTFNPPRPAPRTAPVIRSQFEPVTVVPGYTGTRLPLDRTIMPTAITWRPDGTLAFCSLRGQVFLLHDTEGNGVDVSLTVFEEGLAAPYGLIADGPDLIVAQKPELLRLRDTDGDGRCDRREVIATGWGYNDNYHDWTCGIIRDAQGRLYVGLGSDYAQAGRDPLTQKWRGKILRIDSAGQITLLGRGFRYPTGLAITPDNQVFISDNQGVGNTFNEINHLIDGGKYGVPSLEDGADPGPSLNPAIQIPHPWTRSVNGIFFLGATPPGPFSGHGIGCEYDLRFLMRFSLQRVGNTYQGAAYPFSLPEQPAQGGLLGTLSGGQAPNGDIYIGSIYDSGWLGGPNVGELVRLRPKDAPPLGIQEITAFDRGFVVKFTQPMPLEAARDTSRYNISGYTRKWEGAYATPDSGRHNVTVESAEISADGRSVKLTVDKLQENYVYDIFCGKLSDDPRKPLWPAVGHYTMNRIPAP